MYRYSAETAGAGGLAETDDFARKVGGTGPREAWRIWNKIVGKTILYAKRGALLPRLPVLFIFGSTVMPHSAV